MSAYNEYLEQAKRIGKYENIIGLLQWDLHTTMPANETDYRMGVINEIASFLHKEFTSDELGNLLEKCKEEDLDEIQKRNIDKLSELYRKHKKIPLELQQEYIQQKNKTFQLWKKAKDADNYSIVKNDLEKLFMLTKEKEQLTSPDKSVYDSLLDQYESGLTTVKLNEIIGPLQIFITGFLSSKSFAEAEGSIPVCSAENQKACNLSLLERIGFNFDAGVFAISRHPFTMGVGPNDTRITTRYDESNFLTSLFSTLHEGGHALYEQNLPKRFADTFVGSTCSLGFHESQSRFWENIIGRSSVFWEANIDCVRKNIKALGSISVDNFLQFCREVKPGLIRTEADEVTYNLHIIVRAEIEQGLLDGTISFEEASDVWKLKMKEYLGVESNKDSLGILQDVHWYQGQIGYFPTYMLGNLISAQLFYTMKQDFDVEEAIKNNNLVTIVEWLRKNIHQKGNLFDPPELLRQVTGEDLQPKYFEKYLEQRYGCNKF